MWTKSRVDLACPNDKCPGRHGKRLISFFVQLGCDDVAAATINDMAAAGMDTVQKILRGATTERLVKLEGFQAKKAQLVAASIAGALKSKPLSLVMHASGIFQSETFSMGDTRLGQIVDHVGAGRVLRENPLAIRRKLATLKGLGEAGIKLFMAKLQEWRRFYETIRDLHTESSNRTLASVVACFTGFRSPEAERYITERGGRVASSVSKNVNVLFAGSLGSGKCAKADKLGVTVVAESKMWEWLHALKG